MLDPARLRVVLAELLVTPARHGAVGADHQGGYPSCSCVDRENAQGPPVCASAPGGGTGRTSLAHMRVGVLTGGGDCPGLNAVIRAVVRKGVAEYGFEFVGFRDGWRGPLEGDTIPLDIQAVRGILPRGGTVLGSSRTSPLRAEAVGGAGSGVDRIKDNLAGLGVDALVVIGGEDTLG